MQMATLFGGFLFFFFFFFQTADTWKCLSLSDRRARAHFDFWHAEIR